MTPLHRPEGPPRYGLVLTHGAGGNCDAPLLVAVATAFRAAGACVLRYDLPFRQNRRAEATRDQPMPPERLVCPTRDIQVDMPLPKTRRPTLTMIVTGANSGRSKPESCEYPL